ncbi:MAG: polysaccharide pyruvyl transferase [Acidobacteria bacterium]|nr:polysaccharide pyruvyl transferase [Acidobacteriota bacterium]
MHCRIESPAKPGLQATSGVNLQIGMNHIQTRGNASRVALVGYYGRGNFGDDLMAVLFGFALRQAGVDFTIYRLCREEADRYGFRTTDSARDLLSDARLLLWGGGGLLVPWPRILYALLYPRVSGEYARLIRTAGDLGLRFCALSVGGSGECPPQLTPEYKQDFLNAAEYISVRNPRDIDLLKQNGVPGDYFPDVIWQTLDHFPAPSRGRGTSRIGVDIYLSNLARKRALHFLPLLWNVIRMRPDCEFTFLDSTNRNVRSSRSPGRFIRGGNIRNYQFSDLAADIEFLSSLDLLISSRLHAPMICMGYGVPVLSIFGEKKTALMMENLGMSCYSFGHGQMKALASLLAQKDRLARFLEQFRFPEVDRLRRESYGHQDRLHAILQSQ